MILGKSGFHETVIYLHLHYIFLDGYLLSTEAH